jgi:hypothetical protein
MLSVLPPVTDKVQPQYEAYVDRKERSRNAPEELVLETFFGQLQEVISFTVPRFVSLGLREELYVVFVVVQTCELIKSDDLGIGLRYYVHQPTAPTVLDLTTVECVIGRLPLSRGYAIIDRTGSIKRSWYAENGDPEAPLEEA